MSKETEIIQRAHDLWTNPEGKGFESLKELFYEYGDYEYGRGCKETRNMIRDVLDIQEPLEVDAR